jgi:hypothetical protein
MIHLCRSWWCQMNKYLQWLPTWEQIKEKFWTTRWLSPAINLGCGLLFLGWGFTRDFGWWRDYFMILGGMQIGFAIMWFCTPMRIYHVSPEQQKAMSDDMALVMIQAARRAEEVYGGNFDIERPPTSKMN